MTSSEVDTRYYEVARPRTLADRLVIKARDVIYRDFLRFCRPTPNETILDVGVSDVIGESPNLLERTYPHLDRITAVGLGTAEAFRAAYPEIRYLQIVPNAALPFADRQFDVVTSNAVLEHVGSPENQQRFIAELLRVANRVFITVPHRFFPVEHHTGIPLLHWRDASFALACRITGKASWSNPENLILMSASRLRSLCPESNPPRIGTTGISLAPLSSNLYAYWDQTSRA